MQIPKPRGRQARLFPALPRVRLPSPVQQDAIAALAQLIAQALRPPAQARHPGGPRDGTR